MPSQLALSIQFNSNQIIGGREMKLAIFGAGMIVKDFLSMVGDIPEIELKALYGRKPSIEKLRSMQKEYGIEKIYTDVELCLQDKKIDTVYVALPNHLHYSFAKRALQAGKHVICEKPFTLKLSKLLELEQLALEKGLILIEAITNQYLSNYKGIKSEIENIGDLKVIECNYSQYSSRYDSFKAGTVLPAFNPKMGGGALMDINIYNIHFVVGLLGIPEKVQYYPNIERGIDTSDIAFLDYKTIKVVCIGAKDSTSAIRSTIQGTDGSIVVNGPTNSLKDFDVEIRQGRKEANNLNVHNHRMYEEFKEFNRVIADQDVDFARKKLDHSKNVMKVVDLALLDGNIQLG